jgi:hypothetical protein
VVLSILDLLVIEGKDISPPPITSKRDQSQDSTVTSSTIGKNHET